MVRDLNRWPHAARAACATLLLGPGINFGDNTNLDDAKANMAMIVSFMLVRRIGARQDP